MKKIFSKAWLLSLMLFALPLITRAVSIDLTVSGGLGSRNLTDTIGGIIQIIIGFLGVIAVILILIGGFKWMTAQGNEEKVGEAKKLLGAGVIGLAIILAAYAITKFVIESLNTATT